MIQLSLFPTRGYGVLGLPGLVESDGLPFFTDRKRQARAVAERLAWGGARIVRLWRHESPADEIPTFVVEELADLGIVEPKPKGQRP
jgi:hypothetical protein